MSEIDSSHSETETSVVVADSSALIEESSHHSLNLKETGLLFFIMMIGNFFNYLFAVSMARMLGPEGYAVLMSLFSLFIVLAVPIGTIQTVTTKYIAEFFAKSEMFKIKKLVLKLLKNMLGMGVGLCLILMLASKLIANYLHIETIMPILILSTIFIPSFLTPVTRGALQGLQRFLGFGISGTGESMLRFVFSVALVSIVSTQLKVNVAILGIALSCVGSFIYTVLLLKPILSKKYDIDNKNNDIKFKDIYSYSYPVVVTLLCFTALTNIDLIMVKHFFSTVETGYYAGAEMIGKIVLYLPSTIVILMFPKVASLNTQNKDPRPILIKSLLIVTAVCLGITFCYFAFPEPIVLLLFGKQFISGIPLLWLFGVAMTFYSLVNILLMYQLSVHKFKFIVPLIFVAVLQVVLFQFLHSTIFHILYILLGSGFLLFLINMFLVFKQDKKSYA